MYKFNPFTSNFDMVGAGQGGSLPVFDYGLITDSVLNIIDYGSLS